MKYKLASLLRPMSHQKLLDLIKTLFDVKTIFWKNNKYSVISRHRRRAGTTPCRRSRIGDVRRRRQNVEFETVSSDDVEPFVAECRRLSIKIWFERKVVFFCRWNVRKLFLSTEHRSSERGSTEYRRIGSVELRLQQKVSSQQSFRMIFLMK